MAARAAVFARFLHVERTTPSVANMPHRRKSMGSAEHLRPGKGQLLLPFVEAGAMDHGRIALSGLCLFKNGQTVRASKLTAVAAVTIGFALSACATSSTPSSVAANDAAPAAAAGVAQRDLTPPEKKAIVDAVSPSLRDPASAKYRWAKIPVVVTEDSINYCATVDAKSPYPAYNGKQAYIVEAHMIGGHVASAVMGLIAGGKDAAIVGNMCAKYNLDPNNAS
jgi:hypothetical protein